MEMVWLGRHITARHQCEWHGCFLVLKAFVLGCRSGHLQARLVYQTRHCAFCRLSHITKTAVTVNKNVWMLRPSYTWVLRPRFVRLHAQFWYPFLNLPFIIKMKRYLTYFSL